MFRAFAYRGTDNFRSQELPYSFGIKPPLPVFLTKFPQAIEEGSLKDAFVELLAAQKEDDDKLIGDRVGVGGEADILILWPDNQMLWTCHRFDD